MQNNRLIKLKPSKLYQFGKNSTHSFLLTIAIIHYTCIMYVARGEGKVFMIHQTKIPTQFSGE